MPPPEYFDADRAEVEAALERLLPPGDAPPPVIHQAMRYSVFAGGKRIRPILCLEAARIFSAQPPGILEVACALARWDRDRESSRAVVLNELERHVLGRQAIPELPFPRVNCPPTANCFLFTLMAACVDSS